MMAKEEGVTFLGKLATSQEISTSLDEGEPFVIKYPDGEETRIVVHVAESVINYCEGV